MGQGGRLLLMVAAATAIAAAQSDPPGRVGRLNYVSGTVSFQPGGEDEWVRANQNRPLTTGDHLWVEPNGRAELHIGSAAVRLNSQTAVEFLNLDDRNIQIRFAEGSLEIRLRSLDPDQTFEVDTPNLAFSLLRPGTYRIDAQPEQESTVITVRSGEGEITSSGQAIPVRPQERARITGDRQIRSDLAAAPAPDWFDTWCDSRDRREERAESLRFVSRDMTGYEDLDNAGTWRPEAEYGNVWYPRSVPANWAPYRFGHWAWIEPWGWTWVDDAPWGFAPFHYGRWASIRGSWGWIPGPPAVRPVYAPALVAWVGGPRFSLALSVGGGGEHVGWFPLGPREVYVPSYHASPTYVTRVNTTNTVINNVSITNVYNNVGNVRYVNQSAPNAVTAVPRAAFVGARPIAQSAVAVQPNAMTSALVVRSAEVSPNRESVLGVRASGVAAPRPPQAVMMRAVVSKAPPPPAPVPFVQRQRALEQTPGQPLPPAEIQRIRMQSGAVSRPLVRPSGAPTGVPSPAAPAAPAVPPMPQRALPERMPASENPGQGAAPPVRQPRPARGQPIEGAYPAAEQQRPIGAPPRVPRNMQEGAQPRTEPQRHPQPEARPEPQQQTGPDRSPRPVRERAPVHENGPAGDVRGEPAHPAARERQAPAERRDNRETRDKKEDRKP